MINKMTSLDAINLDEYQDLSQDEEQLLGNIAVPGTVQSSSSASVWTPLIIAIIVTVFAYLINTDWVNQKLQEVPYYKLSLFGLLFSVVLFLLLFI